MVTAIFDQHAAPIIGRIQKAVSALFGSNADAKFEMNVHVARSLKILFENNMHERLAATEHASRSIHGFLSSEEGPAKQAVLVRLEDHLKTGSADWPVVEALFNASITDPESRQVLLNAMAKAPYQNRTLMVSTINRSFLCGSNLVKRDAARAILAETRAACTNSANDQGVVEKINGYLMDRAPIPSGPAAPVRP